MYSRRSSFPAASWSVIVVGILLGTPCLAQRLVDSKLHIATFSIDDTTSLDHRCRGVLPTKSIRIVDPFEGIGAVPRGSDNAAGTEDRILAARGPSSFQQVQDYQDIDFPHLNFGVTQLRLFPGKSFVNDQLIAQQMKPDSFVVSIGNGDRWPVYVPTNAALESRFEDKWLCVGPGIENRIRAALQEEFKPSASFGKSLRESCFSPPLGNRSWMSLDHDVQV